MPNSWALSSDFASAVPSTYDSSKSNTSRLQRGQTWHICYEDQSCVSGDVYVESVTAGGITVNSQTVGVAKRHKKFETRIGREDIFGLSFNHKNKTIAGKNETLILSVMSLSKKLKIRF